MAETGEPHQMREEDFRNIHTVQGDISIGGSLLNDLLDQNTELESKVNNLEDRVHELEALALVQNTERERKIQELEEKVKNLQNEAETMNIPNQGRGGDASRKMKGHCIEADSLGSNSGLKRKGNESKLKQKESQPKKNKAEKCVSCGKNHVGVCLKGKGVCFRCKQKGHIAVHCPKSTKKQGCFRCGADNHQVKSCPRKRVVGKESESTPSGGD